MIEKPKQPPKEYKTKPNSLAAINAERARQHQPPLGGLNSGRPFVRAGYNPRDDRG